MDILFKPLYNFVIYPAIVGGAKVGSLFHHKLRRGFQIHRHSRKRWVDKAKTLPPNRLRIWFHATSTGEFETARPVMEHVRSILGSDVAIIFSYYSPTVHENASQYKVPDLCEILPLDTKTRVRDALQAVKPDAIVFVRYDAWPNIVWEASRMGVRLLLIDAILREKSFRFSWLGKRFSRSLYSRFCYIGAVSAQDKDRLAVLAGPGTVVKAVGDSRFDRILARRDLAAELHIPEVLAQAQDPVWVCGSTWEGDEKRIVPVIAELHKKGLRFHTVIVPHEPLDQHLESLGAQMEGHGITYQRFSMLDQNQLGDVTLVDSVGFLAELYRVGTFCLVGGGFLVSGVHNCAEPAAMALPLCFGPNHQNSPEALALAEKGAAHVFRTGIELSAIVEQWIRDPRELERQGALARNYIESLSGASKRFARDIIETVLPVTVVE